MHRLQHGSKLLKSATKTRGLYSYKAEEQHTRLAIWKQS